MSDLVELLNELNQSNRIEYSDYSQLMFCVEQLEKETNLNPDYFLGGW